MGGIYMPDACLSSKSYSLVVHGVSLHLFIASLFQAEKIIRILQPFRASGWDSQGEEVIL